MHSAGDASESDAVFDSVVSAGGEPGSLGIRLWSPKVKETALAELESVLDEHPEISSGRGSNHIHFRATFPWLNSPSDGMEDC